MGEVVAEMDFHISMVPTKQHKDILKIGKEIEKKSLQMEKVSKAMQAMSKSESVAYQRAMKEMEHARYD